MYYHLKLIHSKVKHTNLPNKNRHWDDDVDDNVGVFSTAVEAIHLTDFLLKLLHSPSTSSGRRCSNTRSMNLIKLLNVHPVAEVATGDDSMLNEISADVGQHSVETL